MRLIVTEPAKKDLLNIEPKQRRKIQESMDGLLTNLRGADLKKLKGQPDSWRLRVGHWRVILEIDQSESIIQVHRIKHRKEAYR